MTTREALREVLGELMERMPDEKLREVLDFARFVNSRAERDAWRDLALSQLDRVYGPDEPEYTEADVKAERPA